MRRATITLPDDLDAELQTYLARQQAAPSLTAVVQAALRSFLLEQRLAERGYRPPTSPLRIAPAAKGSGFHDTSVAHDQVLASEE